MVQMEQMELMEQMDKPVIRNQEEKVVLIVVHIQLMIGDSKMVILGELEDRMAEMEQMLHNQPQEQMAQAKMQILMLLPQMLPNKQLLIN